MQLAFFPWIHIDAPTTIGDVRLIPYRRKDKTVSLAHVLKADVDAIFKAYADRPGKAVEHGVILEIGDWHAGTDMSQAIFDRVWQVKEILTLSALSKRHLFQAGGSYVNSDAYTLVVQNFVSGAAHGFAYSTRRRDGSTSNFWSNDKFAFQRPLHVSDRWRMELDAKLAEALLALPNDDPILEAIREFNAANTDSRDVPQHVELVMVKSALEWLLGIDEKRDSLSKALTKYFPVADAAAVDGPMKAEWLTRRRPLDQRLLRTSASFAARPHTAKVAAARRRCGVTSRIWRLRRCCSLCSLRRCYTSEACTASLSETWTSSPTSRTTSPWTRAPPSKSRTSFPGAVCARASPRSR
jgi:hypothetical protein